MTNLTSMPNHWAKIVQAIIEAVYEQKTYEIPTVIIDQIETLDKEYAPLLKYLKSN